MCAWYAVWLDVYGQNITDAAGVSCRSTHGWNKFRNKLNVILTLIRTKESMIEVNVCSSASAITSQSYRLFDKAAAHLSLLLSEAEDGVWQSYPTDENTLWALSGEPLQWMRSRLFARCVWSDAVCLWGRVGGGYGRVWFRLSQPRYPRNNQYILKADL